MTSGQTTNFWMRVANGAIVGFGASPNDLSVFNASGKVHVIIDVTGYFQ